MSLYQLEYNSNQPTHEIFVGWLNRLNDNYEHGFYDDAVITMLDLAPLRKYRSMLVNLYNEPNGDIKLFVSILSTNESDKIFMVHDMDGVPLAYNKGNLSNLVTFDDRGSPTNISFGEGILLYNQANKAVGTAIINEYSHFGNSFPRLELTLNGITYYGVITINYDGQKTAGYLVEQTPISMASYYQVTNITSKDIIAEIPLLPKHNIKVSIPSMGSVDIASTPTSDLFFRQGISLDALRIKYIDKN